MVLILAGWRDFSVRAQILYTVDAISTTWSTNKCGFSEFTQTCPPESRMFRQQQFTESVEVATDDEYTSGGYDYTGNCNACTSSNSASGSCSYTSGPNSGSGSVSNNVWSIITIHSDDSTTTNTDGTACDGNALDWAQDFPISLQVSDYVNLWGMGDQSITTNGDGTTQSTTIDLAAGGWSGTKTYSFALSDEFMTIDLFGSFAFNTNSGWGSGSTTASTTIGESQTGVSMQASRVRFKFSAPKQANFNVHYYIHYHLDEDTNYPGASVGQTDIYQTNSFNGIGTGTEQEYPSGEGLPINPPFASVPSSCDPLYIGGTAELVLLNWLCVPDNPDLGCSRMACKNCTGMPQWWVTEPYINLWAADNPVEYTTSLGEQIKFSIDYKQRDTRPRTINGQPVHLAINGWNNNWYSYVNFTGEILTNSDGSFAGNSFTNWTATVYEPGGGETDFSASQTKDATTGDQLLPMDGVDGDVFPGTVNAYGANGFRLVHPDGSQDIYGFVSGEYPTNYSASIPIMEDRMNLPGIIPLIEDSYGVHEAAGTMYESATPIEVGNFPTGTVLSARFNPPTNDIVPNANWGDGIMDGFQTNAMVNLSAPPSADAILSEHIDPYGNTIRYNYSLSGGIYQLQSVVDYDGKVTTLSYDTNGYLSAVNMPYGHTASFVYSTNTLAQLQSVTDAQGMTSSFGYGSDNFMSSLTTPYGTTSFQHLEVNSNSVAKSNDGVTRAILITNPDTSHELYAFYNRATNSAPAVYTNQVPEAVSPWSVTDSGETNDADLGTMYVRNSFYWGRAQCASLSLPTFTTNALNSFSSGDFLLARMSHWLIDSAGVTLTGAISLTRDPSPDGSTPGQMSWYCYNSDTDWRLGASSQNPSAILRMMPDGSTWLQTIGYADPYTDTQLTSISTSASNPDGTVGSQTYGYDYPGYTYTHVINGITSTWQAAGPPVSYSWPGGSLTTENSPDSVTLTTTRTNSSGVVSYPVDTYPHWNTMQVNAAAGGYDWTLFFNDREQVSGVVEPAGLVVTNLYGTDGFLSATIAAQIQSTNRYLFANGQVAVRTNALGLTTLYSWDNLDRLTGITYPDNTTISNVYTRLDLTGQKDRLGHWSLAQYNSLQQLTLITNRNGNVTSLGYCLCGGLDSVTDPLGNNTTYNRNLAGWVTSAVYTGNGGNQTTRTYNRDAWGRTTNLVDSAGLNLTYTLNMQGLATNISSSAGTVLQATYDLANNPLILCNAEGIWVTNQYDGMERLTDQYYGSGIASHYVYSGPLLASYTDGMGHSTAYGYDAAGRRIALTDANANTNGFWYNPAGELVALADGNGHVTQWAYDRYGRTMAKADGNGVLVATNGYDANGNLTALWTPAKGLTQYTYDYNGNPLAIAYNSGTNISASFDALDRIVTLSDPAGSSVFAYTNFGAFQGALASEDGPWASDTVTHTYVGRLATGLTLAQPSGSWSQGYSYDSLLRLSGLSSPAGSFGYTYNGAGREVATVTLPGGNSIGQTFGDAGQLLSTILRHGSTVVDSYSYGYDAMGNRTSAGRTDGSQVGYGYDNVGQLTGAVGTESSGLLRGNENLGYVYDPAGNLFQRTNNTLVQTFTTDGANELVNITRNTDLLTVAGSLSSAPTSLTINGQAATVYGDLTYAATNGVPIVNGLNQFTAVLNGMLTNHTLAVLPVTTALRYDANGNLVYDGLKAYGYDCANELTSITVTNLLRTEYVYDGFGRRRIRRDFSYQRTNGLYALTNEVRYVYDGMLVLQERNGSNAPVVTYTRGLDVSGTLQGAGGIGGLLARTDGSSTNYYHADGNGNITALINASGTETGRYLYDPYGNLLGLWGAAALGNTYRFSSKEWDLRTDVYYYGYRYYQPNLQRWLNRDPLEEAGAINLYGYVGNGAVNGVDPYGLYSLSDFGDDELAAASAAASALSSAATAVDQYFTGKPGDVTLDPNSLQYLSNQSGVGNTQLTDGKGNPASTSDLVFGAMIMPMAALGDAAALLPELEAAGALAKVSKCKNLPKFGRLGNQATRDHVGDIADRLEQHGWEITHGGGRGPEEYIPGPGGARKGSSYPDITAQKNGETLRVNTIDTRADGYTPTKREAISAAKIRLQKPDDVLILIPKP